MKRLLIVLLLLAACGQPKPLLSGTVVDKEYDDPDSWTSTECSFYQYRDGYSYCMGYYTQYHEDGEHYKIQVEGTPEGEKETTKQWITVDGETYHTYDIGDAWIKGSLPCQGAC